LSPAAVGVDRGRAAAGALAGLSCPAWRLRLQAASPSSLAQAAQAALPVGAAQMAQTAALAVSSPRAVVALAGEQMEMKVFLAALAVAAARP